MFVLVKMNGCHPWIRCYSVEVCLYRFVLLDSLGYDSFEIQIKESFKIPFRNMLKNTFLSDV